MLILRALALRLNPNTQVAINPHLECAHTLHKAKVNYLVDPASSHMLVSKIKPCMSKYTP